LATGGGNNDRTIKLWNVLNATCQRTVDVESPVSERTTIVTKFLSLFFNILLCGHYGYHGHKIEYYAFEPCSKKSPSMLL